ncbi:hypothetical protein PHOBOS_180 [Erwinia phage vB_EamM_Phobos]|uniref:hypothetical protein n=1 Tax=Erwinia phage vB_EamM_Phobos TaxID=1883377 RepID=UPI00081D20ED|nr:hypothetical protein BIZ79_gp180 [Erwinia phage vB_EamM_Phobos]ANZ50370.1 hypothetical protein PHOBOS_180 [Erwinia phage vB_EamM_Phobos]
MKDHFPKLSLSHVFLNTMEIPHANRIAVAHAVNDLLISLFANPGIPDTVKPELCGEVRMDNLTQEEFDYFLRCDSGVTAFFKESFPELTAASIINDGCIAKTPAKQKIAVYFETRNNYTILKPVGFSTRSGVVYEPDETRVGDYYKLLLDNFVFFGPDAKYVTHIPPAAYEDLMFLLNHEHDYADALHVPIPVIATEAKLHIDKCNERRNKGAILAPALHVAIAALNDTASRKDITRWIISEMLRDEESFLTACDILKVDINGDDKALTVRYK